MGRFAPLISTPLALVMNMAYFLQPSVAEFKVDWCKSRQPTQSIFALELLTCLLLVLHCYAFWKLRCRTPEHVLRRAIQSASRYIFAFFASYAIYILSQVCELFSGSHVD